MPAYILHLLSGLRQLGGRALENLLENLCTDSVASLSSESMSIWGTGIRKGPRGMDIIFRTGVDL